MAEKFIERGEDLQRSKVELGNVVPQAPEGRLFDPKAVQQTEAERLIAEARAKLASIDERRANGELPYQIAQKEKAEQARRDRAGEVKQPPAA